MTLTLEIPETVRLPQTDYLKNALIATLYNAKKISEKEACIITGKNRREFEAMLPQFGLSVLGERREDIEIELKS